MKISTIAAAISMATWSRRLPIVGSICGPTFASSVRPRQTVAASDAA
jgi:hypothetical protein